MYINLSEDVNISIDDNKMKDKRQNIKGRMGTFPAQTFPVTCEKESDRKLPPGRTQEINRNK